MRMKSVVIVIAAIGLTIGAISAQAQQPSAPQAATVQGQLVRVDTAAKTISVKTASDAPMVFIYSDATKVTGAESVAGLATLEGTDVTVMYTKRGQENVATQIDVKKKPAA